MNRSILKSKNITGFFMLMAGVLLIFLLNIRTFAATPCGTDLTYEEINGVIVVSGTGSEFVMPNMSDIDPGYSCKAKFDIPSCVTTIETNDTYNYMNITVTFHSMTAPTLSGSYLFDGAYCYIPVGSESSYKSAGFGTNAHFYEKPEKTNGSIQYVDENGTTKTYSGDYYYISNCNAGSNVVMEPGWYVFDGNVSVAGFLGKELQVDNDENLQFILCDNANIVVNGGVVVNGYSETLTIYGQSNQNGKLQINNSVESSNYGIDLNGYDCTLNIFGGEVETHGKYISAYQIDYPAIGNTYGLQETIVVNGGTLKAYASSNGRGAGIGGSGVDDGQPYAPGKGLNVTFVKGRLIAESTYGNAIGGGISGDSASAGDAGTVTVSDVASVVGDGDANIKTIAQKNSRSLGEELNSLRWHHVVISLDPAPNPPAPSPSPAPANSNYLEPLRNELKNDIANAVSGETIVWTAGDSLPLDIMKLIKDSDVTVEFRFTYEGEEYVVYINKYNVPVEEVEWYGPCYLMGLNQDVQNPGGNYVVVEGDSLNALAVKFGTTVDEIMAKNSSIKNPNIIYVGQHLNI